MLYHLNFRRYEPGKSFCDRRKNEFEYPPISRKAGDNNDICDV